MALSSHPWTRAKVLSPSTAKQDRITKRRRYQRSGVQSYWIEATLVVDLPRLLREVWGES